MNVEPLKPLQIPAPPFTDPRFRRQFLWSLVAVGIAATVHLAAVYILDTHFTAPVRPDDAILDSIAKIDAFVMVSNITVVTQALLTTYGLSRRRFYDAPRLIFVLALLYILRAIAIVLTPLAQTSPPGNSFGEQSIIAKYLFKGMFFSGHTASAFVQAGFMPTKRLRYFSLTLAVVQVVSLLVSHSHYSIDIFGALFVAYFLVTFRFSQLVPGSLRKAAWAPWYTDSPEAAVIEIEPLPVPQRAQRG